MIRISGLRNPDFGMLFIQSCIFILRFIWLRCESFLGEIAEEIKKLVPAHFIVLSENKCTVVNTCTSVQLIYVHMIVQQLIKVRLASMHVEKLRLVHLTGHEKQDNEDGV